jgi:methionine--tRNA ligase beta chain
MPEMVPQSPQPQPQPKPPVPAAPVPAPSTVSIEEFRRIQLVVGEIKEVAEHPNASKLLLLKVDLGGGQVRQLVAGIKGHYEPAGLIGRQVVVAANLAPAVIRGERSEGMVLAAEGPGGAPVLLAIEHAVPTGSKIR